MTRKSKYAIGDKTIGTGSPVFVIAEAGVNHNGSLETAKRLIEVAVDAGADAVKFQMFKAEQLVIATAPKAQYQLATTDSESQLEMLRRLELTPAGHRQLQDYSRQLGIIFLSTPFDENSVDLLDELGVPAFKISSGDLTNSPLIGHAARKGKPLILSTGMANLEEVAAAVSTARNEGCDELVLLHCVSNYPTAASDVNLRAMQTMEQTFELPVGYSDHTEGIEISLAAVALGACIIEKHFTLNQKLPGPDHRASLEPEALKQMVAAIRRIESALGDGQKRPAVSENEVARVARRSLTAAADIPAGVIISRELISLRRPGSGLNPAHLDRLIGRKTRVAIPAGSLLTLEMFE